MNVVPNRPVRGVAFAFTGRFVARAAAALTVVLLLSGVVPAIAGEGALLFDFYGFIRLDAVIDDSAVNHNQYVMWALTEDARVNPKDDAHLEIYPRVTRFGFKSAVQDLTGDVRLSGRIELDFQNGGTESRETPRMRLAYLDLAYRAWTARLGQDWDLISPLYPGVHTDGILWNAGNVGDRRPQARVTWSRSGVDAAVAAGPTGAVDNQDLDKDGERDGAASALPFVQGRIGVTADTWVEKETVRAGAWGYYAREDTRGAIAGHREFESWVAGFDASLPLTSRLRVEGEAWMGTNLSDLRGGIGQGVNTFTGEEIESMGAWAQIAARVHSQWTTYAGASVDDPKDEDVPSVSDVTPETLSSVGRTRNWTVFASGRYRPWTPFQIGLEYYYWVTEYNGLGDGVDNRLDLHFSYIF
jgi:hypothetical protein